MTIADSALIVADDLTGANDTALQYFKNGHNTKIIIDCTQDFSDVENVDIWAVPTESRNISKEEAVRRVLIVTEKLKENLGIERFYKKIDSTLRGNVGVEIIAMLEATQKEAAIIAPAYIEEGRITVGGYQLLNGIPIERTQCALDPRAPIYESYIPDILKKDLNSKFEDLIDVIGLKTVTKGAGPITLKINELIQKGKKLIVLDAASCVDLEQIALAINKSGYDLLPCGSAGLANAFNKIIDSNKENAHIQHVPNVARMIVSGSATQLSANQIQKLREEKKDICFVDLTIKDVVNEPENELIDLISEKLAQGIDVVVHSSGINKEVLDEETSSVLIDEGIAKDELSSKITDFISSLVYEVNLKSKFILIMVGGETSYKCALKIKSAYFEVLDVILPAIPLCMDMHGKIIVTKSGNFGNPNTLIEILNYFDRLK